MLLASAVVLLSYLGRCAANAIIDFGEARIGLALSDPLGLSAQPLESMTCVGPRKDANRIASIAREREVRTIIVGLPLLLSGEEGQSAKSARAFAERLRQRLGSVRVELWDERLSTVQAERTLISAGVRRRRRRAVVDAVAAVLILQNYLDSGAAEREPER